MQIANCLVSLGGDHGNTVMKFAATAAEIAVLRTIHGEDAITEIEPIGDVKRRHSEERGRLLAIYGGAKLPGTQTSVVDSMFPGVAARLFETLDELDLDASFFKATGRLKAQPVAQVEPEPLPELTDNDPSVPSGDVDDADDGVGDDMPDASEFSDPKQAGDILG